MLRYMATLTKSDSNCYENIQFSEACNIAVVGCLAPKDNRKAICHLCCFVNRIVCFLKSIGANETPEQKQEYGESPSITRCVSLKVLHKKCHILVSKVIFGV